LWLNTNEDLYDVPRSRLRAPRPSRGGRGRVRRRYRLRDLAQGLWRGSWER